MQQVILVFHILICLALIGLVLVQHGKGADAGAAFGSGASQTVFGSRGAGTFLLKITGGFAALFFFTSLTLNYLASHGGMQSTELAALPTSSKSEIPATIPGAALPATGTPATETQPGAREDEIPADMLKVKTDKQEDKVE